MTAAKMPKNMALVPSPLQPLLADRNIFSLASAPRTLHSRPEFRAPVAVECGDDCDRANYPQSLPPHSALSPIDSSEDNFYVLQQLEGFAVGWVGSTLIVEGLSGGGAASFLLSLAIQTNASSTLMSALAEVSKNLILNSFANA